MIWEKVVSESKTALVTGAAGGIGRATAERLARNGWNVLAVDLDGDRLAWTQGMDSIAWFPGDVTSEDDNKRMVAEAEARFGGVNAAVFNAGIDMLGPIESVPIEAFRRVLDVNLMGPVLGIRAVLPALRKQRSGAIVLTSSTMGVGGDADMSAYAASKHGVIGLVKALSRELGWEGIRVNAICPGPTRQTGLTGRVEELAPEHYRRMQSTVPLQRWAEPDEMASVIEFLVSPASSYVNGHAIIADGGAFGGSGLLPPATAESGAIPQQFTV